MRLGDDGPKVLSALRLAELMAETEKRWPGALVSPNSVGNLMIIGTDGAFIGYVDFLFDGEIEV